jgi:hypothetical protein
LSHIVTLTVEIKDVSALQAACGRLALAEAVFGKTSLFSGEVEGWAVKLPDWQYPVVCDVAQSKLHYDNFSERWGKQQELDRFLQAYAVERARAEARKKGCICHEETLVDGSIKLTIQLQGGTA